MSQQDPPRLKLLSDTPDALQDALRVLSHDDPARLARVAQKLGPLLDAAPPAASTSFWSSTGKLWANKLLIAGLTLGAATLWLATRHNSHHRLTAHDAAVPGIMKAERDESPAPAPTAGIYVLPMAPVADKTVPAADNRPHPVAATHAERKRPTRIRAKQGPAQPEQRATSSTLATETESSSQVASAEEEGQVKPQPEPQKQPAPATPPRSEEELLFEARSLLSRAPKIALQLLDEHKSRFQQGLLAPEREVMAIETLRKLGRKSEADARLAAFQARHPDSLHLKRLLRAAP